MDEPQVIHTHGTQIDYKWWYGDYTKVAQIFQIMNHVILQVHNFFMLTLIQELSMENL
jgi:hypothetical protein